MRRDRGASNVGEISLSPSMLTPLKTVFLESVFLYFSSVSVSLRVRLLERWRGSPLLSADPTLLRRRRREAEGWNEGQSERRGQC